MRLSVLLLCSVALLSALDVPVVQIPHAAVAPPLDAAATAGPAWQLAAVIPALTQSIDRKRAVPDVLPATQVRLMWTDAYLFIRFECADQSVYLPFDTHDAQLYRGDVVEVFLDPVGDARQWFELQVAANNATFDQNLVLTGEPRSDADGKLVGEVLARDWWVWPSYEMDGLKTAASKRADGWTVELAIPAKSAGKRVGGKAWTSGQKLRANLMRYEWGAPAADGNRPLIAMNWAPVLNGCPHTSPQAMGVFELVGSP